MPGGIRIVMRNLFADLVGGLMPVSVQLGTHVTGLVHAGGRNEMGHSFSFHYSFWSMIWISIVRSSLAFSDMVLVTC